MVKYETFNLCYKGSKPLGLIHKKVDRCYMPVSLIKKTKRNKN